MPRAEVVVVAVAEIRPEAEDEALAVLSRCIRASQEEPGCLSYALHRDQDTPTRWVMVERWASAEALGAHFEQPYLAEMLQGIAGLVVAPPAIHRLDPVPVGDPGKGVL